MQEDVSDQANADEAKLTQFKMLGIPADRYRSTDAMNSVETYMKRARSVFDRRWSEPRKPM